MRRHFKFGILLAKTAKSRFVPLFGGLRGNMHGSTMARWKARGRLPISANWTFFRQLLRLRRYEQILYWSKLWRLKGGWVTLSANFREKGESYTSEFWRQKTRFSGLSYGVVCVIVRAAVLIELRLVTDRRTDTRRRLVPALASVARVKKTRKHCPWSRSDRPH